MPWTRARMFIIGPWWLTFLYVSHQINWILFTKWIDRRNRISVTWYINSFLTCRGRQNPSWYDVVISQKTCPITWVILQLWASLQLLLMRKLTRSSYQNVGPVSSLNTVLYFGIIICHKTRTNRQLANEKIKKPWRDRVWEKKEG